MSLETIEIPSSTGEIYDTRMNEFCCNYLNNLTTNIKRETLQRPKCSISPINFQQSIVNTHHDSGISSSLNFAEYPAINDSYQSHQSNQQPLPSINQLISPFVPQKTLPFFPEAKHFPNNYLPSNCTQNDSALGQSYLEASTCNSNFLTSSPFFMNNSHLKNYNQSTERNKLRDKRLSCLLNPPESITFESTPNKSVKSGHSTEPSFENEARNSIDFVNFKSGPKKTNHTSRARINFHSIIDLAQSSSAEITHFNDPSYNTSNKTSNQDTFKEDSNMLSTRNHAESLDSNSLCFNEKLKNMISISMENKENSHDFITRVSLCHTKNNSVKKFNQKTILINRSKESQEHK
jgi:hypothetical protein